MTKTLQSNKQSEVDAESVPSSLRIVCDDASSINLQAAEAAEEGKPALRKFSMVAYTGGAMRLGGWPYPVVVDLAGMRVTRKSRPILKDHDRGSIVGHTDDIMVGDSRLEVAGVISGVGNTAQEVIATSENGFPWQASLGANALSLRKSIAPTRVHWSAADASNFRQEFFYPRDNELTRASFAFALLSPSSSWVDNIPFRWGLLKTAAPRCVVAKAIKKAVPQWPLPFDNRCFKRSDHIGTRPLKNHEAARKVFDSNIRCRIDTPGMLAESRVELGGLLFSGIRTARLPPSFGDSLTNINRKVVCKSVQVGVFFIWLGLPSVVDRVNTSTQESFWRWKCPNRSAIEKANCILDEFDKCIVGVDMLGTIKRLTVSQRSGLLSNRFFRHASLLL